MKRLLALFPILIFLACSTEKAQESTKIAEYFDLSGTLDSVVNDLLASGASLRKTTEINDEKETVELNLTTEEDWKRQLELFYEADINKVGLSGAYQTETLQAFDGIEKRIYSSIKSSSFVKNIECTFRDGKLFSIRILASDKNLVYGSNLEYILHFNHFKSKMMLDHYSIKADEKMLFKGPLNLQVIADVILD